jgi:pyruvate dehydrogenase E2 component (dihydrolipoamide acetyltransferase)
MPTNILMPALSPTMEKGNLAKWLKKEGDKVKSGDIIAEIETDKATMEYEAVDEGTIAKIVVPEGTQDVAVNAVIAVLAGEGEDVKAAASSAATASAAPEKKAEAKSEAKPEAKQAPKAEALKAPAQPAAAAKPAEAAPKQGARVFASPLAKRLAKDAGVDLSRVEGSGPHGRVIARDVEAAKSGKGLRAPGAAPAAAAGAPSIAPAMSDQQILGLYEEGSYDLVPHDSMRRTSAQRLTAATYSMPTFYLTVACDIGMLTAAREEINAAAPKDKDVKHAYMLTVNDFVF